MVQAMRVSARCLSSPIGRGPMTGTVLPDKTLFAGSISGNIGFLIPAPISNEEKEFNAAIAARVSAG